MLLWALCTKQIIIPILLSIICVIYYESLNHGNFYFLSLIQKINFKSKNIKELYSSVSCRGNNHTNRFCSFKNLCFEPASESFIFFHNTKSVIIGVPEDRFSPALIDFSSVYDHNTQYFNFIDLPDSAFLNFSTSFVSGTSMLFKRFNPENLMHVFHDDLIPAFVTLNEFFLLNERENVHFVLADGREPGPYAHLYDFFLDTKPLYLNSISSNLICFEKVLVGLNKHSLWYQYGFKEPQAPLNKDLSTIFPILIHFREYFKKRFTLSEVTERNIALLLTRGYNRKILNADAVAKTIESRTNLKTHIINLENYSLIDVIEKIMMSKLVVGMHGSILILSIFMLPNSHVIELFPYAISSNICTPYRTLAEIPGLGLSYHFWENKIQRNSFPHPEYPTELGGIFHFPKYKQEAIKNSIVKPFLCCYNPEWLYRIYQDTIVDLQSFSDTVTHALLNSFSSSTTNYYFNRLYPSEVQNITCKLSLDILNITWEKPWNVYFMNATTVEYELWFQDNEENDVKAFIMKKTYFVFPKNISTNIYVWIRCHINGRIGPFNSDPLICQNKLHS